MASHETGGNWEWKEGLPCDPQECPEFLSRRCRKVMNLHVIIPEAPGLGVWQIDTSSHHSMVNTNSIIKLLKASLGRCSMIPLTLVLGPREVSPPGSTKKKVNVLSYKIEELRWADLARLAPLPPVRALLPEPEVEEPPEDLFPEEVLATGEVGEKAEPFPEEELFPEDSSRELLRREIGHLLAQGPRPSDTQIKAWWDRKGWGYALQARAFTLDTPLPDTVQLDHLKAFRDSLHAYQESHRTKAEPTGFKSWQDLAERAARLEPPVFPGEVFKKAGLSGWSDFADYETAWTIVQDIHNEKKKGR